MAGAVAPNFVNRTLWTRDNLDVLRGLNSASIHLVYADPPFNSNKNYEAPIGTKAADAIRPFFCQVEAVETPRRVCIMPHRKNGYGFWRCPHNHSMLELGSLAFIEGRRVIPVPMEGTEAPVTLEQVRRRG